MFVHNTALAMSQLSFTPTEACSNTRNLKVGSLLSYKHGRATSGGHWPQEPQLFICKGNNDFFTGHAELIYRGNLSV